MHSRPWPKNLQAELAVLSPVPGGCESIKDKETSAHVSTGTDILSQDMATCLSSKDGSANATWEFTPYKAGHIGKLYPTFSPAERP